MFVVKIRQKKKFKQKNKTKKILDEKYHPFRLHRNNFNAKALLHVAYEDVQRDPPEMAWS